MPVEFTSEARLRYYGASFESNTPRPIAGVPGPKDSVYRQTSTDSCREPRTIPVVEHAHPNLHAAMSVVPRTRRRWQTPLRLPLSLFDDTFLNPPRLRFDAADSPAGNPSRPHAAGSRAGNPAW